jgi:hypothetical protein
MGREILIMPIFTITTLVCVLVLWSAAAATAGQDCISAWKQNPVSQSCKEYSNATSPDQVVPMVIDLQNGQCRMTVTCENQYGGGVPNLSRDIDMDALSSVHNCNGYLQVDPC